MGEGDLMKTRVWWAVVVSLLLALTGSVNGGQATSVNAVVLAVANEYRDGGGFNWAQG